jgi:hypothetical protein
MTGKLKPYIAESFEECFMNNCLILFDEAYQYIKGNAGITIDWEEENISANFFKFIDNSGNAIAWNINISDEHRLYYRDVLIGNTTAKSASRIDFRLTTNWTEQMKKLEYYIEAKNLIESDCYKNGRKTKINAKGLHERYINTGIDNFISGKYPQNGCLVGYILQGNSDTIVRKINACLKSKYRDSEKLLKFNKALPCIKFCFKSNHINGIELSHYMLNF